MKRIVTLTLALAATFLGMGPRSQAESLATITRAVVPFTFAVGSQVFPPGTYVIAHTGAFVSFRGGNGKSGTFLAPTEGSTSTDARSRLLFDVSNHHYFLRKIVTPYASSSMNFPKSKWQKQAEESVGHIYVSNVTQ